VQLADSLRVAFAAGTVGDSAFSPVLAARGLAQYYAWTGNPEESLAWLERAYAISPEGEDYRMIASGIYDKVRNDPRFKAGLHEPAPNSMIGSNARGLGVRVKATSFPRLRPELLDQFSTTISLSGVPVSSGRIIRSAGRPATRRTAG